MTTKLLFLALLAPFLLFSYIKKVKINMSKEEIIYYDTLIKVYPPLSKPKGYLVRKDKGDTIAIWEEGEALKKFN